MSSFDTRSAVLLDRHPLWLDAVENVLRRAGVAATGRATSAEGAVTLVEQHRPDLLVVGVDDPGRRRELFEALRRARERRPGLKVIVLSPEDDPDAVQEAFEAGAAAYVLKTAHPDDVAAAVRQAFDRSVHLARSPRARQAPPGAPTASGALTRREREILELVAEGLSNADVARTLWLTEQTVKVHLSRIYRKLGVSNRTEASRRAGLHGAASRPR